MMIENHRTGIDLEDRAGLSATYGWALNAQAFKAGGYNDAKCHSRADILSDDKLFLQRVTTGDWKNPEPRACFDLAIIGAGPAGIAAAELAARLGFSVALVERNALAEIRSTWVCPVESDHPDRACLCSINEAEEFGASVTGRTASNFAQ